MMSFEKAWWELPDGDNDVGVQMVALYRTLESVCQGRTQANLRHIRLYNNQEIAGLSVANYVLNTQPSITNMKTNRLTLNVVKSCIDTLVAKLSKTNIKPTFLTSGGSWKQQRRAQALNKFITGLFYKTDIYSIMPMGLRDAFIFGDGYVKVFTDSHTKELVAERIFPDEIMVDPNDAYYGKPRVIYQRKFVSKSWLLSLFPEKAEMINKTTTETSFRGRSITECVLVVEAWRNSTKQGKKDGRHVIAIASGSLLDEPYSRTKPPIAHMHYTEQPLGYFGMGVAEELIGIQVEINRILMHIVQCMRLISNPRVFLEAGSVINKNQLNNEIGGVVEYSGQPPIFSVVQSVAPEYFQQMQNLYQKAYEIVGVSALTAQSKNPLGANASGKALRQMNDIETERFMLTGKMYEKFHIDVAELMLEEIRHSNKNIEVKSFNRKDGLMMINSSDLELNNDDYVMQVFPVSALPDTPQARLETVTEMINSGFLTPSQGMDLLDFPDIDAHASVYNSPERLIKKQIEKMLDTKEIVLPEPYENLTLNKQTALMYYNYVKLLGDDEDSEEILRQYIDSIDAMMTAQPEPQMQPPAPAQALLESQLAATPETQAVPNAAMPNVI